MEAPESKTERICCNCHHYRFGHLNDPCEQGNKKCGYLHEGCGMWKKAGERSEDISGDIKPVVIQAKYGRQRRKWTEEEDQILREMYPLHSIRMIEVKLNRSRLSVYQRATKIGLRK